tara:strand:- start:618 stop:803 length:186 start_codon:yes stop_codon:yes gene_type:complete
MEWLSNNWQNIMSIATSVVGAFAIISTMTPNPSDDKAVNQLYKLINFLGANFGKSRNEGAE